MRPILAIASVMTLFAVASPAAADWSFTRWGMTPAQVVRASGGTARLHDVPPNRGQVWIIKAVGTVRSGDLVFDARYYFEENRLVDVSLILKQGTCRAMLAALQNKYGPPEARNPYLPFYTRWVSRRENVRVQADTSNPTCEVSYKSATDGNSTGL